MDLKKITLQLVQPSEQKYFQSLMEAHHYLGALPKIGRTLWYAALYENKWIALLSFSAAAWKCAARDQWIGWHFRHQYDRLHLVANNSCFLILPEYHYPNLASRILSLCEHRISHYVFITKDNQLTLADDIRLAFENRQVPDYSEPYILAHGRLESRSIWTTTRLNDYLDFPFVGLIFAIQRHTTDKKTGKETKEIAYGLTSHSPESAGAKRILKFNREHWGVESHHYIIDWNWNEDRCSISKEYGPENITCLRRFATGLIKSISKDSVLQQLKS